MKAYLEAENPDIVLVGITAPKQEKLAAMLLDVCDKPILCVGAVFDYMAYDSRPPTFVRKFGLEWIYRLLLNPRKMFPRVRTGITFLIYAALMQFRRISRNI
jgi:exopolysaccharide biosynthesis WecB/TagA/CpsF family protein